MAILALTELDCIKMDWVQNGNQFFVKMKVNCNKLIYDVENGQDQFTYSIHIHIQSKFYK